MASEELKTNPIIGNGEISNFYNNSGAPGAERIETAFNNAYRSIIARDANGSVVGAIRASFDGVYAMIWDLQVGKSAPQNGIELKSELLSGMMNELQKSGHAFIAAIVPRQDVPFYHNNGLPYGDELTVTRIDSEKHALRKSPHPIQQNDHVTPEEVSHLFAVTGWKEEAEMGEQFAHAFNTALCNFTARDDNGTLIGMVRAHFDGKVVMRWNLVVHPDYRKQGLGFNLLSHLLDFIIAGNYESYALAVNHMVQHYQKLAISPDLDLQVVTNNPKL